MSLAWVRQTYTVPAKRGGRVRVDGKLGTITGATNHIMVRFDGQRYPMPCHPCWHVRYLDAADCVIWPLTAEQDRQSQ